MTKLVRSIVFLLVSLAGFAAQPSFAASVEPIEADRIVAIVGTDVITYVELRSRLASALKQLQKQGTPLPPQDALERQMLERLIMDRAQLQYARDSGMRVDDTQLDQAIGRIAAGNKMSVPQFRAALEKDGVQYASFREEIRNEMIAVRLREREVDTEERESAVEELRVIHRRADQHGDEHAGRLPAHDRGHDVGPLGAARLGQLARHPVEKRSQDAQLVTAVDRMLAGKVALGHRPGTGSQRRQRSRHAARQHRADGHRGA